MYTFGVLQLDTSSSDAIEVAGTRERSRRLARQLHVEDPKILARLRASLTGRLEIPGHIPTAIEIEHVLHVTTLHAGGAVFREIGG